MIYSQVQFPGFSKWQARLARVPRWVWVAFFIGVMIPVAALLVAALAFGLVVVVAVVAIAAVTSLMIRLFRRPRRMSNEIVVRAVRVVDP